MSEARLQRILAEAGLASRRQAEEWIRDGRVKVNGVTAAIGDRADPARDRITVGGRLIPKVTPKRHYWMINKPAGYTSSVKDRHADRLVTDLVPAGVGRLFPVGRLDTPSRGLLLLTDDGWLAHRLMHPSYGVAKVYEVVVEGFPGSDRLARIRRGLTFEEGRLRAESARVIDRGRDRSRVVVTLREGRKRELRRLFQAVGNPVLDLVRTGYGSLTLGELPEGSARPLRPDEVQALYHLVGGRDPAAGEEPRTGTSAPVVRAVKETKSTGGSRRTGAPDARRHRELDTPRPRNPVRKRGGDSPRPHR